MTHLSETLSGRIAAVDALRGYAILMVFAVHCAVYLPLGSSAEYLLLSGRWGVQLFFVVSGFCIMQTSIGNSLSTKEFALRRLFRIAPLYWLAVGVFTSAAFAGNAGIMFADVVMNVLLVHALSPAAINAVVPGGWSVGVEIVFYIFFWCMRGIFRTLPGTILVLVLAVALEGLSEDLLTHAMTDVPALYLFLWPMNQLPAFLAGVLAWHLLRRVSGGGVRQRRWGVVLFGTGLAMVVGLLGWGTSLIDDLLAFVLAYMCVLLGLCLAPLRLVVSPASVAVGRISYGVYLTHIGLLTACHALMGPGYVMVSVAFVLSLVLAYVLHVGLEVPAIRLGKTFSGQE